MPLFSKIGLWNDPVEPRWPLVGTTENLKVIENTREGVSNYSFLAKLAPEMTAVTPSGHHWNFESDWKY